jgi:hypothetical protein
MNIGEKDTLEAKIYPIESHLYTQIFWTSSNPGVASVDAYGVVTAIYSGTCIITAMAGKYSVTCEVKVNTFDLELDFSQAVAYFLGNGNYGDATINTSVLRFYSDGYNIEIDGSVSGSGYYFHTEINYPMTNILPPNETYTNNENHQNFTFLPAKIEDDYLSGTFFVFSSLEGTNYLLIKDGNLIISDNSIIGNFTGVSGENIEIKYYNEVRLIDKTLPPPDTLKLNYTGVNFTFNRDKFGNGTNTIICQIYLDGSNGTYLQLEFVVPISTASIPVGFYRINASHLPYSLVETDLANISGTIFVENFILSKEIMYGNVKVENVENAQKFTIYLVDEDGKVIVGEVEN